MNEKPVRKTDEVDLFTFFSALGNVFKSLFNFFKSILIFLFDRIVFVPYVYFKKFKRIVLPLFGLAFVLGLLADLSKKDLYKAEVLLSPSYDSGKELYSQIEYLNSLIALQDTNKLAEILNISPGESASLIQFKIAPNYNERINIKYFNEYVYYLDSLAVENISYESFVQSLTKQQFDYPQHVLEVISDMPSVFGKLNPYFNNLLEDNELFKKRRDQFIATHKLLLEQNLQALKQIDSLRSAVDVAIKNSANAENIPGGSVIVGTSKIEFPETKYDLFQKRTELLNYIQSIKKKLSDETEILKMNSTFPEIGEPYQPLRRNFILVFLFGLAVLLITVFNLLEFIIYLNKRYEATKNQT